MWWEAVKCAAAGYQYIIMDLPLLFEAGVMVPYMHKIIVVTCEEDLQLQRLMEQRHLSERDAKLMIGAQMNLDQKADRAQFVIENSGSLHDTTDQVSGSRMSLNNLFSYFPDRCPAFTQISQSHIFIGKSDYYLVSHLEDSWEWFVMFLKR